MAGIIVIGARGETAPYATLGLTCFEPERRRLVERILAERARCAVLAITRRAHDALPLPLIKDLRAHAWPDLAIVPAAQDVREATAVKDALRRRADGRHDRPAI